MRVSSDAEIVEVLGQSKAGSDGKPCDGRIDRNPRRCGQQEAHDEDGFGGLFRERRDVRA